MAATPAQGANMSAPGAARAARAALQLIAVLCAGVALGAGAALAGPASPTGVPAVTTDSGGPAISWTWSTIVPDTGKGQGYVEFQRACSVCHGSGPAPGTRALRAKYRGKLPALLEQRTDLAPDYVKFVVRHGVSVMPPFRKTELSDAALDAIAGYLGHK
jgi:(+)-pinoresinol hydroxylase